MLGPHKSISSKPTCNTISIHFGMWYKNWHFPLVPWSHSAVETKQSVCLLYFSQRRLCQIKLKSHVWHSAKLNLYKIHSLVVISHSTCKPFLTFLFFFNCSRSHYVTLMKNGKTIYYFRKQITSEHAETNRNLFVCYEGDELFTDGAWVSKKLEFAF